MKSKPSTKSFKALALRAMHAAPERAVPDVNNPELTPGELAGAVLRRGRGAQKAPTKQLISLRLDADVIDAFRATGTGWQVRINEQLRAAIKRLRRAGAK